MECDRGAAGARSAARAARPGHGPVPDLARGGLALGSFRAGAAGLGRAAGAVGWPPCWWWPAARSRWPSRGTRRANRRRTRKAGPGTRCARCRRWPAIAFTGGVFEAGWARSAPPMLGHRAGLERRRQRGRRDRGGQLPLPVSGRRRGRPVQGVAACFHRRRCCCWPPASRSPWSAAHPGCCGLVGLVWGGVGGALYTLAMIRVAHEFAGRATAGGAAAIITGYTLGGTVGPAGQRQRLAMGRRARPGGRAVIAGAATCGPRAARPATVRHAGLDPASIVPRDAHASMDAGSSPA